MISDPIAEIRGRREEILETYARAWLALNLQDSQLTLEYYLNNYEIVETRICRPLKIETYFHLRRKGNWYSDEDLIPVMKTIALAVNKIQSKICFHGFGGECHHCRPFTQLLALFRSKVGQE